MASATLPVFPAPFRRRALRRPGRERHSVGLADWQGLVSVILSIRSGVMAYHRLVLESASRVRRGISGSGRSLEDEVVAVGIGDLDPALVEAPVVGSAAVVRESVDELGEVVDGEDRGGRGGLVVGEVYAEFGAADVELDELVRSPLRGLQAEDVVVEGGCRCSAGVGSASGSSSQQDGGGEGPPATLLWCQTFRCARRGRSGSGATGVGNDAGGVLVVEAPR